MWRLKNGYATTGRPPSFGELIHFLCEFDRDFVAVLSVKVAASEYGGRVDVEIVVADEEPEEETYRSADLCDAAWEAVKGIFAYSGPREELGPDATITPEEAEAEFRKAIGL